MVSVVADVYASIADADPALVERIAEVLELRAGDPQQQAMRQAYLGDVGFPDGARVLEVGCGTGPVTRTLAAWPPPGRLQRPRPLAGAGGERAQLSLPWPDRDRPARGTLVRTPNRQIRSQGWDIDPFPLRDAWSRSGRRFELPTVRSSPWCERGSSGELVAPMNGPLGLAFLHRQTWTAEELVQARSSKPASDQ
jgi:hypothetical protein